MPHQYNISLNQPPRAPIALLNRAFSCYFLVKCVVEEIYLVVVVHGERIILFFVIYCYRHVKLMRWLRFFVTVFRDIC